MLDWLLMSCLALLHCIHNVEVVLMGLASGVLCRMKDRLFLFYCLSVLTAAYRLRTLSLSPVSSWAASFISITTLVLLYNLLFKLKHVATLGSLWHGWSSSYRLLLHTFLDCLWRVSRKLLNQMSYTAVWELDLLHFLVLVSFILPVLIKHWLGFSMYLLHRIRLTDKIWRLNRLLLIH